MLVSERVVSGLPALKTGYLTDREQRLEQQYLGKGYVVAPVASSDSLNAIQQFIVDQASAYLQLTQTIPALDFLNSTHRYVASEQLNGLRVKVISALMQDDNFRQHYYALAKPTLDSVVGNEVVMQRGIGLSVQLPQDISSLLNIHSDTWSGDSPFESVVWLPLVDCYKTKSMFICSLERSEEVNRNFNQYEKMTNAEFLKELEPDLTFLEVPYGSVLVFNQNQLHGNVVNEESETRWSMNCRFKSVFSPYCDKKLGEFFEPINLKPASQLGLSYQYPGTKGV